MSATIHTPPLPDRYLATSGTVYLSGIQALVRLLLDQSRLDRARGLRTAGFVSGYEGSPLAGYDLELARRRPLLADHDVVHRPGLNEELAATAVQGSQVAPDRPDARYAGVFGVWYGKAPGLDRATDAIRHANLMGTHHAGGVVALVGDDSVAKSSTVPSASELALAELGMPTVYPADSQEVLDLGLHAIALSRASGLWAGMKLATNVADGGGVVQVGTDRIRPLAPEVVRDGQPYLHQVTAKLVGAASVQAERTAFGVRMQIAREYAAANGLNVIKANGTQDRFGIVSAGKSYLDVCQAMRQLGIDDETRARSGIRTLKLGMIHPLEPTAITRFAEGLEEILVVEEKRPFLETAIKEQLYGLASPPRIVGKRDHAGTPLLSVTGELDVDAITTAVAKRLSAYVDLPRVQEWIAQRTPRQQLSIRRPLPLVPQRTPYFCSGCPHNRSTRVPEGSAVGAGIGCHAMVLFMEPDQVGDVVGLTQMGGEGAQWLGMEPFVASDHLLQNLGDGTFFHSGSLAIRAAVAANAKITFKLLYNSAVAMTGGQQAVGVRSVPEVAGLLSAEGVARLIITTEDPRRYRRVRLPRGVEVWHRDRLDEAQRTLAEVAGVTVLIHDQQCAVEKRRSRKRDRQSDPEMRVLINERICEGCGDCGAKSNCLSVQPVSTEYGRKTQIHQSSCNTDYSCLDGECPSFVTVYSASDHPPAPSVGSAVVIETSAELPEPAPCVDGDDFTIRITGIGGTGVVTIAQIVATAAHMQGLHVRSLDQTGLSQKGGAVVSDLKASRTPLARASKLSAGECDLYLGCDVLAAVEDKNLSVAEPKRTVAIVSTAEVPTGHMVVDPALSFPNSSELTGRITAVTRPEPSRFLDARALALDALGDDQFANIVLLGAAYQVGALPLPLSTLREAISLNGVAVEENLRALELGRAAALGVLPKQQDVRGKRQTSAEGEALVARIAATLHGDSPAELTRLVAHRASELIAYHSARYAEPYLDVIERVWRAENDKVPGSTALTEAVTRYLYKLMAYKDEYEVARLCLDPAFRAEVTERFGPDARFAWRLHPPALRALGLRRKISLGQWARPILMMLRAARRVRGTRLDLFGMARVRRIERQLISDYRALVDELLAGLDAGNHGLAVEIAELPDMVRGYEHIKLANVARYEERLRDLREKFSTAALLQS